MYAPRVYVAWNKKKRTPDRDGRGFQQDLSRAYSSQGLQALQGLHALQGLSPLVAPESVASSEESSEAQPESAMKEAAVAATKRLVNLFMRYLVFSCGKKQTRRRACDNSPKGRVMMRLLEGFIPHAIHQSVLHYPDMST